MRKYILITTLLVAFFQPAFSQDITRIVQHKVDSLKKLLKTAKGNTRIDLLNDIAYGYYWIWDDDNTPPLDSACAYTTKAFNEATKNKYKRGLGYAYLNLSNCQQGRQDTGNVQNKNFEMLFKQSYAYAKQAIKIGEDLKDDILLGSIYNHLTWFGKWKKDPKFKFYVENAIMHFERSLTQQWKGIYTPIGFTNCNNCLGVEFLLGNLYMDLSTSIIPYNSEKAAQNDNAISYFQKANAKSNEARAYLDLSVVTLLTNTEAGIDYIKKSISLYQSSGDENGEFDGYIRLCNTYYNLGDFENGILFSKKSVALAERIAKTSNNDFYRKRNLFQAYNLVGKFYSIANDFETALAYLRKAGNYPPTKPFEDIWASGMAEFYRKTGNRDSVNHYTSLANRNGFGSMAVIASYIFTKDYDKALQAIEDFSKVIVDKNNPINRGWLSNFIAKAYYGKNDYNNALINARTALSLSKETNRNLDRINNYQLLSDIFSKQGKYDSAYIYLKQYTSLRDSILNKQLYIRLNDYKKEAEETKRTSQIKLLQKDNLIKQQQLQQQILMQQQNKTQLALLNKNSELKDQQLLIKDQELLLKDQHLKEQEFLRQQKESQLALLNNQNKLKDQQLKQQSLIKKALFAGLLLLLLLGFFVFRSLSLKQKNERLKNEKKQAELQQLSTDLEMQALRAQMNPHFIFNCLSSINKFILKSESRAASNYLTRFSRLIRMVLTNSQLSMIPLSDEIEMLRLYLDMERLRFSNSFDYNIIYANTIEPETIYIPPMLLQPFCENAIWHGLMHKPGQGKLDIVMSLQNGQLQCIISDNGVGRAKALELKSKSGEKQKSFGLKITTERLALFNNENTVRTFYNIEDLIDEEGNVSGTEVALLIKLKDDIKVPLLKAI